MSVSLNPTIMMFAQTRCIGIIQPFELEKLAKQYCFSFNLNLMSKVGTEIKVSFLQDMILKLWHTSHPPLLK